jgi:hypothetical protein
MFRALGSTTLHQAMNDRMRAMLGEQGESRMHQLLGARYAGCSTRTGGTVGGAGMMGGSGMMGGYYSNDGIGAMMQSGDWSWMTGGAWQHMTRHDWQRRQQQLLGPGAGTNMHNGWSTTAIIAVCLGGILLVSLAILAIIRRPFGRPPTAAPSP